jgi:hypothetical protein
VKGDVLAEQRWHTLAPLTGVLFVVLVVAAFIIGGESPDIDDSPQEILDFYRDNDSDQVWAGALLAWGTLAFLFFLGVLRSALQAAEGGVARLSAVAFGGGLVLALGMLSFAGFTFVLGDAADDLTPEAAQALHLLNSDFFFPVAIGLGALMISTAIIAIRSKVLPGWLAWITLLIGIAAITPIGFFAFLVFGLWTLVVSLLLWRAGAAAGASAPPAPGP